MSDLSEHELRRRWKNRWEDFLGGVEEAEDSEEIVENILRDKRAIGNAERKIAGGHEGREILELLQNARDAIWEGESEWGRVHVGVHDEGVLVANTGSKFDLFDKDVEDAVTMIGETGKGDEDDHSIGHKGVGLKSILATGDSFEIFTRPDEDSEEILGVRLSRAYLVNAVLSRTGHETGKGDVYKSVGDPDIGDILRFDPGDRQKIEIDEGVRDSVSKLPLFSFPVPLEMNGGTEGIQNHVRDLLTESIGEEREAFRTAVFIRYEDEDWRSLLNDFDIPVPDEDDRDVEDRPDRIWEYLSSEASAGGLRPETVVQLGGIEELHLRRVTKGQGNDLSEKWEITQEEDSEVKTPELEHRDVRVHIFIDGDSVETYAFDRFTFRTESEHHTSILVNKSVEDSPPPVESYPLYLFYPIENTSEAELPFCFHGRFQVETNRKDLSKNQLKKNRRVLEEGLDLIELVGEEVASATYEREGAKYSTHLPWSLLPPVPEDDVTEPTTQKELISWFQSQVLEHLTETKCIATSDGPCRPRETLLHWEHRVLGGYIAFEEILTETGGTSEKSGVRPLPDRGLLEALSYSIPISWNDRVREILTGDDDDTKVTKGVLEDWSVSLDASLSCGEDDPSAIEVDVDAARSLLTGTVALFMEATDEESTVDELLDELSGYLDGVYLLPCRTRDSDEDNLALVTLETRTTPSGDRKDAQRTRSVIWGVESETQDVDRPPIPPRSSNMTVYFLDADVQDTPDVGHVLGKSGRFWGIREYEGIPSFVRSLLDSFTDGGQEVVEPTDFAFLAAVVDRLGTESKDLRTGEGDFFPLGYLDDAVTTPEGNQRANLRRRTQLRRRQVELHGQEPLPIDGTVLGDGWQKLRAREEVAGEDAEEDPTAEWTTVDKDMYPARIWPEPDSSTWDEFREQIKMDVDMDMDDTDFVRTLSLLGTGTLPWIRVVWMYGDEHPPMRRNPHWNPTEWNEGDFDGDISEEVENLRNVLGGMPDYLSTVTGPGYHPQETAGHSQKCSVKTDRKLEETNVVSWIWVENVERLEEHDEAVREVLKRHGEEFENLLWTGWSCNYQHQRRSWNSAVPSLLNWQVRSLDVWDTVVEVDEELEDRWGKHTSTLRYAVRMESERGAQAARMFPHVSGENDFSESLLDAFGVQPIDELGSAEASDYLQKLQSVLVDGELPDKGTKRLWVPGGRMNDWNQAYNHLLRHVLKRLPDEEGDEDNMDWGNLTHLPLRDGDDWVAAPLDWVVENNSSIRYYRDDSPKPWEKQEVEEESYLILPRTPGPFTRLTRFLSIEMVDASKLVFDPEEIEFVTEEYEEVPRFGRELAERRDVLVASTEKTDENEVEEAAKDLSKAAENLTVAESFPEEGVRQLSDPSSALYSPDENEDEEALVLNASEADGTLSLESLAMGVSLLFESPTKVATFREALDSSLEVDELEDRWEKRTFPIEPVKRTLGSNAVEYLEERLNALNSLLEKLGNDRIDIEPVLAELGDSETENVNIVSRTLVSDEQATEWDSAAELAGRVDDAVPEELSFVVKGLFSDSPTYWAHELKDKDLEHDMEVIVVRWLDENKAVFGSPPFDKETLLEYERFRTVSDIWNKTDRLELTEVETWRDRLRELHSTGGVSWTNEIPPEYAKGIEAPPRVVYLCAGDKVDELLEGLVEEIDSELDETEFDWRSIVESYVFHGEIPDLKSDKGAVDHQKDAFGDIATSAVRGDNDGGLDLTDISTNEVEGLSEMSTPPIGGGGGGGSNELRGRGQQAEAYVMTQILDRLSDLLKGSAGKALQFKSEFRKLEEDQKGKGYKWHVDSVWSDFEDLLHDDSSLEQESITDWRSKVADGTPLRELPVIRLVNVTMERGPGFDVIDPLGPLSEERKLGFDFRFVPVEVKAVDGDEPPFRFRLTTNEYRRAKAFVRDGEVPYVIRLVRVPEPGTPNWIDETEVVAEKVLRTIDDVEETIDSDRFEEHVKGGYMNMRVG